MARGAQKEQSQAKKLARDSGGTPEERAAAKKKAEAGSQAGKCEVCKQTFSVSQCRGNPPQALLDHVTNKHKDTPFPDCFKHLNPVMAILSLLVPRNDSFSIVHNLGRHEDRGRHGRQGWRQEKEEG
jgi:hypothetical protein